MDKHNWHWHDDHSFKDDPRWPYNTEWLLETLASGDRVEMARFFRAFEEWAGSRHGTPLHWQRFVGKILLMAAENPGDAIIELGLSKNTVTLHRDELLTRYIHRLKIEEEKRLGEEDYSGSLGVALIKAEKATGIKYGTLSRVYSKSDDIIKCQVEKDAASNLPIPLSVYLDMITALKKK